MGFFSSGFSGSALQSNPNVSRTGGTRGGTGARGDTQGRGRGGSGGRNGKDLTREGVDPNTGFITEEPPTREDVPGTGTKPITPVPPTGGGGGGGETGGPEGTFSQLFQSRFGLPGDLWRWFLAGQQGGLLGTILTGPGGVTGPSNVRSSDLTPVR